MKKILNTLTGMMLVLGSALFFNSCSSDSNSSTAPAGDLTGIWSISNVVDAEQNSTNMQLEFMTQTYESYAPTIGQTITVEPGQTSTIPTGALAYVKTTVTTINSYYYSGNQKTFAKEVGYYTVSNTSGTNKLTLYAQVNGESQDGISWTYQNEGGKSKSVTITEYTYSVNGSALTFRLPDLTQQVWTKVQ